MMTKVFLTADPHFGHKNIIEYENRPFNNTEEMDEEIIKRWNNKVGEEDVVLVLGDMFVCGSKLAEKYSKRLNGRITLVLGNHDHFTKTKYKKMGINPVKYLLMDGYLLTHHPQSVEAMKTAQEYGYLIKNLHGHVHTKIARLDTTIHQCLSVELTNYEPVSFDFIKKDSRHHLYK
jgi:calcineurin-like phosphoesterase family protein